MRVLLISSNNMTSGLETPLPLGLACVLASEATWDAAIRNAISQMYPDVIGISVRNIDDQDMQSAHFFSAFSTILFGWRAAGLAARTRSSGGGILKGRRA